MFMFTCQACCPCFQLYFRLYLCMFIGGKVKPESNSFAWTDLVNKSDSALGLAKDYYSVLGLAKDYFLVLARPCTYRTLTNLQ